LVFYGSYFAAFGTGFGLGRYMKPTISHRDGYCTVPKEYGGRSSVKISKLYADERVADVTCVFIGAKKICKLTNEKCLYLT